MNLAGNQLPEEQNLVAAGQSGSQVLGLPAKG